MTLQEEACTLKFTNTISYKAENFQRRKQRKPHPTESIIKMKEVIGRLCIVHPRNPECFFLRLLLNHIRGPSSFQDLRTIDGVVKDTYRQACIALGLQEDDHHWHIAVMFVTVNFPPQSLFGENIRRVSVGILVIK